MEKNLLHTISDEDAIHVALILLKSHDVYKYEFDNIVRRKYDFAEGTDAEEAVNVYFDARVKDDGYRQAGWKDRRIYVQLIERNRYHEYPYFVAFYKEVETEVAGYAFLFLANQVEAVEYLQAKKLL